jgi:hypothetical protein
MEPFSSLYFVLYRYNEYLQKEPDREVLSNTWDSEKAKVLIFFLAFHPLNLVL